jgi:hypothetical protein
MHSSCRVYLYVSCDSDSKWPPFLHTEFWLTGHFSEDRTWALWGTNWIFMWLSYSHRFLQTSLLQTELRAPVLHLVAVSFIYRRWNLAGCLHFRRTNGRTVAQSRRWLFPSNVPPSTFFLTFILLMWRTGWAPNIASRWQMGFNLAFKGLVFLYNHKINYK